MSKTVEEQYKSMSEIDHILHRPGMYVGSTKMERKDLFIFNSDEAKMEQKSIEFIPAMLKCFDEIISNSCDEFRRPTNYGLTDLWVKIQSNGNVMVKDNGGIPVVMHKDAGCYVPEFIFGRLRTSSNYDDTEDRNVIGTNGVGSKICNVFSTKFSILTADGEHSYFRTWMNNMRYIEDNETVKPCKDHFLETRFTIDFSKFETDTNKISVEFTKLIEKRCIDAAAANPGLNTHFSFIDDVYGFESEWSFKSFEEYIELYSDYVDQSECIKFSTDKQSCWVYPDGSLSIGFVNGAECSMGTHIRSLRGDINNEIAKRLKAKHDIDVSLKSIDNKYSLFCSVVVSNPSYDSQTKDTLTTPPERFDKSLKRKYIIPTVFLEQIASSEIVNIVLDWYKQKVAAEDKKAVRKMNKKLKAKVRSEKFIDANSKNRQETELWLFEGDSAKSGFRIARNPQTQGAYICRGVIKNVMGLTPQQIMKNQELSEIFSAIGLQFGQYNDAKKLHFGKIVIATDADHDGDKIAGLMLVFFNLFPELYEQHLVFRSMSPIMTATKGSDVKEYYSFKEYKEDEPNLNGYKILYSKGLGGLNSNAYRKMMQNPRFVVFEKDELADASLRSWFGKGIARVRKGMLADEV